MPWHRGDDDQEGSNEEVDCDTASAFSLAQSPCESDKAEYIYRWNHKVMRAERILAGDAAGNLPELAMQTKLPPREAEDAKPYIASFHYGTTVAMLDLTNADTRAYLRVGRTPENSRPKLFSATRSVTKTKTSWKKTGWIRSCCVKCQSRANP